MMTAVYVRVSTAEQNEQGQRNEIKKWLENHGIGNVEWFVDKGASGDTLKRPEFKRLQRDVSAGKVAMIVVWKLDRLSRTIRDGMRTLYGWFDKNIRFVSVTQDIDLSGAIGEAVATLFLAVAQIEQKDRRERQAAGIAVAKAKGVYKGRRPGTTKARPGRAKELRERGLTNGEIAASLKVSPATVRNYLKLWRR